MNEMARPQYLTGSGKAQKLKRAVPTHLRTLAGKTAWIKRIPHRDPQSAKREAHNFAAWTDSRLLELEAQARGSVTSSPLIRPSVWSIAQTPLTDYVLATAMRRYFAEEDQRMLLKGAYRVSEADDEALAAAIEDLESAGLEASGEVTPLDDRLARQLLKTGLIDPQTHEKLRRTKDWPESIVQHPDVMRVATALAQANIALAEKRLLAIHTGHGADARQFFSAPGIDPERNPTSEKNVADLESSYLAIRKPQVGASRFNQLELPMRAMREHLGAETPLTAITRAQVRSLAEFLPHIPAHATKRYKGQSLRVAAEKAALGTGTPANRFFEARKHFSVIQGAFRHACTEGWVKVDPAAGIQVPSPRSQVPKHSQVQSGYQPFSIEQLNRIFALPLFHGCQDDENGCHRSGPHLPRRHRYWAPIIALWTGMRSNEILQLEKEDIGIEAGVHYIAVTDEASGPLLPGGVPKRLKTKGAVRNIPIHPQLAATGLVDWVQLRPSGRLFPEAVIGAGEKLSDQYSKRFRSNLKAARVWSERRFVFHSFRHLFADRLREAGVPEDVRHVLQGWSEHRSIEQRYGSGYSVPALYAHISRVTFPGLDWQVVLTSASDHPLSEVSVPPRPRRPSIRKAGWLTPR
jgi:integrase